MYPRKINRDMRKLKWQYEVRNMPKKRLPAILDRAVWEKKLKKKGRAGRRRVSVVEKVWKGMGGNQEEMMSAEKFGRYKADAGEGIERWERLALRNKVKSGERVEMYGGSS